MSPKNLFWHGSPYLIADDNIVPGSQCGRAHFQMNRNNAVFVTSSVRSAINMGAPGYSECVQGRAPWRAQCAPFLYLAEPKYLYDVESKRCHPHILDDERQCRRARIRCRFYCEDIFKPITEAQYIPMGDNAETRIPFDELEQGDPDVWLRTF